MSARSFDYPKKSFKIGNDLPEKIIQFGTGVLLRGLCDAIVHQANEKGIFNGKIVVVKSTSGANDSFEKQNNQYTVCIRGISNGKSIEENFISTAISRVLFAQEQWNDILSVAQDSGLEIVISNTTEIGIQYVEESIFQQPPSSFPAKLTAFLYERFIHLGKLNAPGFVIVPTELIVDNADLLKEIIAKVALYNSLPEEFFQWLDASNTFCNSLVDRIVPGMPIQDIRSSLEKKLGYADDLLIVAEEYKLWAIQGDEKVREVLSFYQSDSQVVIQEDITDFRELKLRLLNGTHTLSCGLAYLAGRDLVREMMSDEKLSLFVENLMLKELAGAVPGEIHPDTLQTFGRQVLDRFSNPFIDHKLLNITLQYTTKMKARNIPMLVNHYQKFGSVPSMYALGFAGYLLFMKAVRKENDVFYGERLGQVYPINCDFASYFYQVWQVNSVMEAVEIILGDVTLWNYDLSQFPGFTESVSNYLKQMIQSGVGATLKIALQSYKVS